MAPTSRRLYTTAALPPAEQFAYWRESICEAFAALEPQAPRPRMAAFDSLVEVDLLGDAAISLVQSQPQRVVRAAAQIRRDPRDRLFLNVMLDGASLVEQDGRRCRVHAGEAYVVDARLPYVLEHPEPFRLLCLDLPRSALPRHVLARPTAVRGGRGALAMALLRQIRDDVVCDAEARREALQVACGWLADGLSPRAGTAPDATSLGLADTWRRAVRRIDADLRDPALTPAALAAELRVSLRYLHKAFAAHGAMVAGTIRTRRLDACAEALARGGTHRTIASIALDCGFGDVPHFHRAFRAHLGMSPKAYRQGRRTEP